MVGSVTLSVASVGQSEGLHLQRDQLDAQLRRHQEQILGFAVEALTISCFEQLLMVQQARVSFIWEEEDIEQRDSKSFQVIPKNQK